MHDPSFLRSPPFPWVSPAVAAVSGEGRASLADPDALIAAVCEGRVGGAFWSDSDPWRTIATVRARPSDDDAIVAWIEGREVCDPGGAPLGAVVLRDSTLKRMAGASYRDPFTGRPCDAMAAVAILSHWRRNIDANRQIVTAVGMAAWKRDAIAQFLWNGRDSPGFASPDAALRGSGTIAYWPSRTPIDLADRAAAAGLAAWPVEDGFLRSNGLGAECRPPMSILVDRSGGIYFDPARPSELETILETYEFSPAMLDRARSLRLAIIAARLGKYGVDCDAAPTIDFPNDRRIVLAIGQVDDDLSVLRGGSGIAGNRDFLTRVRAAEPDAVIVYRPHPDVVAGLRQGRVVDPVASGKADRIVTGGSLLALLDRVDGVHVLSSLTGFEALLRGRDVTVHGQPFYAGWGLTRDLALQPARRTRRLTLDQLVAGALIVVPRYRDPKTELPCEVETLVARLAATATPRTTLITGFRRAFGATRRTLAAAGERL